MSDCKVDIEISDEHIAPFTISLWVTVVWRFHVSDIV